MKLLSTLLSESSEDIVPKASTALVFARKLKGNPYIELVSVKGLLSFRQHDRKNDPKFSKEDSDETISKLKKSIYESGFQEPLVLYYYQDRSALLVEGNHRLSAAQELGITHVPVTVYYQKRESPLAARKVPGFEADKHGHIPSQLPPSSIGLDGVFDLNGKVVGTSKQKPSSMGVTFSDIEDQLVDIRKDGSAIVVSYDIDSEYKYFVNLFDSNSDIEWEDLLDFEKFEPYISSWELERLNIDEYYDIRTYLPPTFITILKKLLLQHADSNSEQEEINKLGLDGLIDVWEYKRDNISDLNNLYLKLVEFVYSKWLYKKHMLLVNDFLNTRFTSPYGGDIFINYTFNGMVEIELDEKDLLQFKSFTSTDKHLKVVLLKEFKAHGFALHYEVPGDYKKNRVTLEPKEMGKALDQSVKELI